MYAEGRRIALAKSRFATLNLTSVKRPTVAERIRANSVPKRFRTRLAAAW